MSLKATFEKRLRDIDAKVEENQVYKHMLSLGRDVFEATKGTGIVTKVEGCPNKMVWGCVWFHVRTLPDDVVLKLWWDSDTYYAGFYQKYNDFFDQLIPGTINEQGVMMLDDIDTAEARILDYLANEEYGSSRIEIIS